MKDIDYEAIEAVIRKNRGWAVSISAIKDIIEAYEAQKAAPEWVPLDLEKVKQGWEVRPARWANTALTYEFVSVHKNFFVTYSAGECHVCTWAPGDWLMQAPKPKTVKVFVYKQPDGQYIAAAAKVSNWLIAPTPVFVGEGEIEVTE